VADVHPSLDALAEQVVALATSAGVTVATAESVTGGRVAAALTSVPGSSAVVRGGVVAYANGVKSGLLGVDPTELAERGPVSAVVAAQMAAGARAQLGASYAVATTGEAGPDPASGASVGTVHIAVSGPTSTDSRVLSTGNLGRERIQQEGVVAALELLARALRRDGRPGPVDRGRPGTNRG
jgi:nicotinamide-nucleotide amidase